MLARLRGLRLRGMLLTAARTARERAGRRPDRRAMARVVMTYIANDCPGCRASRGAAHSRAGGALREP